MRPAETFQQLADREAIAELPALYSHYVHTQNIDQILNLFDADGELEIVGSVKGASGTFKAGPLLRQMFENGFPKMKPWPFVHNQIVRLESASTATGVAHVEIRSGTQGFKVVGVGYYNDTFVKTKTGEWKFRRREYHGENLE